MITDYCSFSVTFVDDFMLFFQILHILRVWLPAWLAGGLCHTGGGRRSS
jgi:hypothetical protein